MHWSSSNPEKRGKGQYQAKVTENQTRARKATAPFARCYKLHPPTHTHTHVLHIHITRYTLLSDDTLISTTDGTHYLALLSFHFEGFAKDEEKNTWGSLGLLLNPGSVTLRKLTFPSKISAKTNITCGRVFANWWVEAAVCLWIRDWKLNARK